MSLRQRGQRPSEATNEGGYYAGSGQGSSPYNIGMNQPTPQQQPQYSPPPPNSGYQQQQATPSSGYQSTPSGGGGYYGNNTPATPSAEYAAYTNNNIATPQHQSQQGAPSYLSQTAPPAYHHQNSNGSYGNNNNQGSVGINLHAAGYQRNSSSSYGGYSGGSANIMGNTANSFSPYQKPSSSNSGFTFKHILLSLFTITCIVLTGTTFYYRNVMISKQSELNIAKVKLEKANAAEKRANNKGRGGGYNSYGVTNNKKKKKKNEHHDIAAQREKLHQQIAQIKSELKSKQSEHNSDLSSQHSSTQEELEAYQSIKQDLLKQIDHTQYLIEDAKEESAKYKAMVDGIPEMEAYMKKREGALFNRVEVLESKIGGNSRREAEEWFGPGPHHVEIELEYPKAPINDPKADPFTWSRIRRTLTLEMAPLDLMPHTVNLFLQQVHHELWDGTRVHYNPRHIFQIGPSYHEEDELYPHYDNFYKMGLDKVSFQEYSKEHPHSQWTVGMAGRPAGPDFYINKIDNTHNHGPGGQPNEDDMHNEADPCFAKIINDGHLILQDIDLIPYKSIDNSEGIHGQRSDELMYPVTVISAKILAHEEGPVEVGYKEVMHGKKLEDDEILPLPDVPHGV